MRQKFESMLPCSTEGSLDADLIQALDEFEEFADTFNYFPVNRPLIDSLSAGMVLAHRQLSGSYWRRHCIERPLVEECWLQLRELGDGPILNFFEQSDHIEDESVIRCWGEASEINRHHKTE